SQLALWQANWVKSELEKKYPGMEVTLTKIKTIGDKILDVPLAQVGGKGLFVKEIEEAMLRDEIDIAVHSMKDVPTDFPEGLGLYCITEREDPRDAVISRKVKFSDLPQGARIGTSALRRQAQLLKVRPDLQMCIIRGNVETRIRKLTDDNLDAVILAAAGLKRLGFTDSVAEYLDVDLSIPAIGQGALGIECRLADPVITEAISFFNHPDTSYSVRAERALLKRCEGGCQVPIAAHGTVKGDQLRLVGFIASVDGQHSVRGEITGSVTECEQLGIRLADQLLAEGGKAILEEVYQRSIGE
ncbi:MAG: hydroxymethylbilane synthase, partial [Desulfuromonadaceae bacterium]|nr:hydroxymethylbilane synthase [Desulfuromonadaceae bacterium]